MEQSRLVSYSKNGLWAIAALMITTAVAMLAMPSGESDAATSGTCGENITWTLEDGHLIIEGTGDMYFEDDYYRDSWFWGTDIKSFEIRGSVTSIGDFAFGGCKNLTTAVIPSSVDVIGASAFSGCTSLKSVEIQGNLEVLGMDAFGGCTSLERIKLPDVIGYVGIAVLFECDSIKYINIPSSFDYNIDEDAGPEAFEDLTFLDSKGNNISTSIRKLMGKTFVGENSVVRETPDNVKFYANGLEYQMSLFNTEAFLTDCLDGTTRAIVPDTVEYNGYTWDVTKVGTKAFYGSKTLMSIELPDSVTKIEDKAFTDCTSLRYIEFPDSLESIGDGTFFGTTFKDSEGNVLDITSDALRGKTFVGKDGILAAMPEDGSIFLDGGLSYRVLSQEDSEAELIGYYDEMVALVVPETVEHDGCTMKVTRIGTEAFSGCDSLKSVAMTSVEKIGKKAFYGCSNLRTLELENVEGIGVKAFAYCVRLSDASFGESLSAISAYAFYKCRALDSIEIPDSMSYIGSCAFYLCANLKNIDLGDSLTKIFASAFSHCPDVQRIMIPESLTTLGSDCFGSIRFLDSNGNELEITPENLRGHTFAGSEKTLVLMPNLDIGDEYSSDGIVYEVTNLFPAKVEVVGYEGSPTSVVVPETIEIDGFEFDVPSIGNKAFYGCRTLTDIEMPYVDSIGVKAFARCSDLTNVEVGDGLKKISAYAFFRCSSLQSFDAPSSLKVIGSYTFYECYSLTSFVIPDKIGQISPYTFYGCVSLEDVVFGSSIKSIENYAFYRCTTLKEIDLGESLKKIGACAFSQCSGIEKLMMPLSLDTLEEDSFGSIRFLDDGGDELTITPNNLAGYTFTGTDMVLVRELAPEIGDRYSSDGIVYEVTKIFPTTVEVVGYEGSPTSIVIPEKVKFEDFEFEVSSIGNKAFYECASLENVEFGSSLLGIGEAAFSGCGINQLNLSDNVEFIDDEAFWNCPLEYIYVPDSLQSLGLYGLGKYTFYYWYKTDTDWDEFSWKDPNEGWDYAELPYDAKSLRGYAYLEFEGDMYREI